MSYKNKEDQARASAKHYSENKEKVKERSRKRNRLQRERNSNFVSRVKRRYNCVDCGESDVVVLDFDHVEGEKAGNVSDMSRQGYSIEAIKKEIRKCEVRCSNCHRRITHQRRTINKHS